MLEQNLNSNSNPNAEKFIYKVFDHSNLSKQGDEFCILWYTILKKMLTTYLAYAAVVTVMRTSLDCISHTEYRSGIVVIMLRQ